MYLIFILFLFLQSHLRITNVFTFFFQDDVIDGYLLILDECWPAIGNPSKVRYEIVSSRKLYPWQRFILSVEFWNRMPLLSFLLLFHIFFLFFYIFSFFNFMNFSLFLYSHEISYHILALWRGFHELAISCSNISSERCKQRDDGNYRHEPSIGKPSISQSLISFSLSSLDSPLVNVLQ